jgi:hypothetical protein
VRTCCCLRVGLVAQWCGGARGLLDDTKKGAHFEGAFRTGGVGVLCVGGDDHFHHAGFAFVEAVEPCGAFFEG